MAKATKEQFQQWAKSMKNDAANLKRDAEFIRNDTGLYAQYRGFDPAVDTLIDELKATDVKRLDLKVKIAETVGARIKG